MVIGTELNYSNISWTEPVRIWMGHGISISIDGAQSALSAMTQGWPKEAGNSTIAQESSAWQHLAGASRPRPFATTSLLHVWNQTYLSNSP